MENFSGMHNIPVIVRFWSRVSKSKGCWMWNDPPKNGKPMLKVRGRAVVASRFCFELHFGKIPRGMLVCHTCDIPACMNPAHLFLGTPRVNMDDKVSKGRQTKGEEVNTVKLTEELVKQLRDMYASGQFKQTYLAHIFGITQPTVSQIILRRSWKHV